MPETPISTAFMAVNLDNKNKDFRKKKESTKEYKLG
jgi:hypothetical protein